MNRTRLIIALLLCVLTLNSVVFAQDDHDHPTGTVRPESERPSPVPLNPAAGAEIGSVFEAYLTPQQEGGEEEDTPAFIPSQFRSTAPSTLRNERTSHGHAIIEFTNDLSRAYVHLAVANVNPDDVVMLHLHCGRPGQLGPIIVDFGMMGNVSEYLADGTFSLEVTNEDIETVLEHGEGLIGAFTAGCPIVPGAPSEKVVTIAGMELIARQGELYFNLHTAGQVYFGDIRGQFHMIGG